MAFDLTNPLLPSLISVISGLSGVMIGGLIANRRTEHMAKQALTVSMLDEFHATNMRGWRALAHEAFKQKDEIAFSSVFNSSTDSEKEAISMVFHYFEKVAVLIENDLINKDLFISLMGRYILWWLENVIAKFGPEPDESLNTDLLKKISTLNEVLRS